MGEFVSIFIPESKRVVLYETTKFFLVLDNHHVLTAAHCLVNAKSWEVHLGALKRSDTGEEHRVVYKTTVGKPHPEYNSKNLNNDLGLLYFEEELHFSTHVQPAKLYKHHVDASKRVVVSGWGLQHDGAAAAETLQYAPLKTVTNEVCADVYTNEVVKETVVCTKGTHGESACNGDSGGPLVLANTHELVGLVSFGHAQGCEKGYPTGYTRVNYYLDWLEKETGKQF